MADTMGALIGIVLILFLCSPILLAVYMWNSAKVDIDSDLKEDLPNRWSK